jgi:TolB-like protein/Tfp pilus assembly protein PilF
MKRCPQCRRDYYDDSLLYCLDDGASLLEGPASTDGPATAILASDVISGEAATRTVGPGAATDSLPVRPQTGKLLPIVIAAVVVLATVLAWAGYRYYYDENVRAIGSIAVMPFVNDSGNADIEYLSDGMTETLIRSLSQVPNLNVKARSSVFRYKGKDADAKTIGSELGVQAILNGRVIQRGDQLSLNLELIDAATENVIWTDRYERKSSDLVNLQSEIARDVSQKLSIKLSGADQEKLAKNYTSSTEAYQLYLQGNSYWEKRGQKNIEIAIGFYQQAIEKDPNYALAYAGLAQAYAQPTQQPQGMPKAREAAQKALSLDNSLAEAHSIYGRLLAVHDYDLAGAEREYVRAIELNPNFAAAHSRYAALLAWQGKFGAAEAENRRALELEPLSLVFNSAYGEMLVNARRYDDAIIQLKKTLELDERFFLTYFSLATVYQLKGNYAESVEMRARRAEINGNFEKSAAIRESFAKTGWEGYLRYEIGLVNPRPDREERFRGIRYDLATMYASLAEKGKAFEALNDAYENREFGLLGIKVDPRLDPLRDDPRYAELIERVGFPE